MGEIKEKYFLVSEGDKVFRIPLGEISHFTARKALTIVNTKGKEYIHAKNIGSVQEALTTNINFVRTHKSYLLNMNHVAYFSRSDGGCAILKNNSKVPVARRLKRDFLKSFGKNITDDM